jgi:CheY-like chemotaxis protein
MESDSARSTILIVDDDPAIVEYAGGVLEEYGYAVLTASNAASALVMLRSNEGIDLLFTDLVMPGFDGIELARRAGEDIPGLKVLFTTGYSTDPAPNGRLLKKPYRPQQFAGAIAAALARKRAIGRHVHRHRVRSNAIATISTGQNSAAE